MVDFLSERLELRLTVLIKGELEGLARDDGVSLGEEVRRLVKREVARRRSRKWVACEECPLVRTTSGTHC